jgi:hypothetical protein
MIAAQFNNKWCKRYCDVMFRTCDVITSWARQTSFSTLYVTSRYWRGSSEPRLIMVYLTFSNVSMGDGGLGRLWSQQSRQLAFYPFALVKSPGFRLANQIIATQELAQYKAWLLSSHARRYVNMQGYLRSSEFLEYVAPCLLKRNESILNAVLDGCK